MENTSLFEIGTDIFEDGLAGFVIHAVIVLAIAWTAVILLKKLYKRLAAGNANGRSMALRYGFEIIRVVIYTIAVFSIINKIKPMAGIGTALLTTTSVVTVIAGLAAQAAAGNLISGMVITVCQPFQVGDAVSLPEKGITGRVQAITFRHTVLNTPENTRLTIPNSVMDAAVIEDRTESGRTYRKFIKFVVSYDTDVDLLIRLIRETVEKADGFSDARTEEEKQAGDPAVPVRIDDFTETGMLVTAVVNMESYDQSWNTSSDIRIALANAFRRNGIRFAQYRVTLQENR